MLKIDLSNKTHEIVEIPADVIRKYVGGRGLGAYLLYYAVPAGADPLGEENHIMFTAGPASATGLYFSSKANLCTKSPLTGIYLNAICSGTLAAQMRRAGFWALDIHGASDAPVYIVVRDSAVSILDAAGVWGRETAESQKAMLGDLSAKDAATVAIGPAGEQLHTYAAVFGEGPLYRCFGRGGGGAVMGSKKLKGIVVAGTGEVSAPDKQGFEAVQKKIVAQMNTEFKDVAARWRRYETGADLETLNQLGIIPTRNWRGGQFEGWQGVNKSTTPMGWPEQGRPCGPYCLMPGCREVRVQKGPYKGARSDIEWETIYAFGTTCGVDKMEAVIAAGQICDEFGVDTMTAGITIGFAMECFERGLINEKETGGIDLRFGNDAAMIAALKMMVNNEGFGKQLAKGIRRLSEEIKGSEPFAMHVKGLELGGYECRGLNGQALQFAVASRGGCHHSLGLPARKEVFDGSRLDVAGKGGLVKGMGIGQVIKDSLVVCSFCRAWMPPLLLEVLSSLSPEPYSMDEMREVGVRVLCMERLFNMREGISRKDDVLPDRLLKEPKPDGPTKGSVVPLEELKDDFYKAMGYDLSTGNPPDSLLAKLGIEK